MTSQSTDASITTPDIFAINTRLGRGVNLGNALEAPHHEGEMGMILKADYFSLIAQAGFDSVRIPIRWSAHAEKHPPYAIDPRFMARVDWALAQAKANHLAAVIDLHHYDELLNDLESHRDRFLAMWRQIAERYSDQPPTILFELFNEPRGALTAEHWNALLGQALAEVRRSNPTRGVVVGPTPWNSIKAIDTLHLPSDQNLIVSFHFYQPFRFTHQGANWIEGSAAWLGTNWEGNRFEQFAITALFEHALKWAQVQNRPLYMGEFGAFDRANLAARARWTRFVAQTATELGISFAYWEFGADFGVYDRRRQRWNRELLGALLGRKSPPSGRLAGLLRRLFPR
jgi:endoglucanase